MISSSKFEDMLHLVWSNPVFGDSFPPNPSRLMLVLRSMHAIYPAFVNTFEPVVARGMPSLSPAEVQKLVQQIASEIIVTCSAVAAGELTDLEQMRAAVTIVALFSLADQTIDSGDEAMW